MTAIRRPSRRLDTTPQRLLSMGLATATAVGLVGVLAVRSAENASADTDDSHESTSAQAKTSDGRTQADLDRYAVQLDAERQRLQDYRDQLVAVAAQLQQQADALASGSGAPTNPIKVRVKAPKAAPAPKAQAAPKASAPKAQAQSKSS